MLCWSVKILGVVDDCFMVVIVWGKNDIVGFGKCKGVCLAVNCFCLLFMYDIM